MGGHDDEYGNAATKHGFWQCSICTSENTESLPSCDICGVFRDSLDIEKASVQRDRGIRKSSGVSLIARSLFRRSSPRVERIATISNVFPCKEPRNCSEKGNVRARFADLQKALIATVSNRRVHIAPFRFDTPSPDDIIYARKNYSRLTLRADSLLSASNKASSSDDVKGIGNESDKPSSSRSSHLSEFGSNGTRDQENAPHIITSKLHHLNLDKKSGRRKAVSLQYKPEKWILSDPEGPLGQLNLAIVGHADSGKSTISGRLLNLAGRASRKEMHKYEKEAKGKGKFVCEPAIDESTVKKDNVLTMAVTVAYFSTKKYRIVLLDSPGHKDSVPKMISGAALADAAILVVDASAGFFEAGMEGDGFGQTKEHAQLIRSSGIEQIIVAINKMDVVEFSKERFDFINSQLSSFLRSCGFKESSVTWIPLSASENQNLLTVASEDRLSSWYHGCSLVDAINSLQLPHRDLSKPLIMPICDVTTSHSVRQVAVGGKLENGAIRNGLKVLVLPSGDLATVRSIERDSHSCNVARAGDHVSVTLQVADGVHVMSGGLLCLPDFPVKVASCLELKVLLLDISTSIIVGCRVEFQGHHAMETARVIKLVSLLDQKTGRILKNGPPSLTAKQSAVIQVELDEPVCVEEFSICRALGRVFLRASGNTIAVGIITRVLEGTS